MKGIFTGGGASASLATEIQSVGYPYAAAGASPRAIMQAHGTGGTGQDPLVSGYAAGWQYNDWQCFADSGLIVGYNDWGHTVYGAPAGGFGTGGSHGQVNFGNDEAIASVGAMWTWLKANTNCKQDKVVLAGGSMGVLTVLNWARQNVSQVKAIVLSIPLFDLYLLYGSNHGGHEGDVATVYGLGGNGLGSAGPGVGYNPPVSQASWEAAWNGNTQPPSTHSPLVYMMNNPSDLAGIPIGVWASDDDTAGYSTSAATAFAGQVNSLGCQMTVFSGGAQGHNMLGFSAAKVAWLRTIGAL